MARFSHILVPIDFSETSSAALDYAVELASKLSAHLTILHVVQPTPYDPQRPNGNAFDLDTEAIISAERESSLAARRCRGPGRTVTELLRKGLPWEEIQLAAVEIDADLIVMGTHGRRGLARIFLGSVAQNVVQTSSVPVLIVRHEG